MPHTRQLIDDLNLVAVNLVQGTVEGFAVGLAGAVLGYLIAVIVRLIVGAT